MVEMLIKYAGEDKVKEMVIQMKDEVELSYLGDGVLSVLDKPEGGKKCQPRTGCLHPSILSSLPALPGRYHAVLINTLLAFRYVAHLLLHADAVDLDDHPHHSLGGH